MEHLKNLFVGVVCILLTILVMSGLALYFEIALLIILMFALLLIAYVVGKHIRENVL